MAPVAQLSQSPVPSEAFERFPGKWIAIRSGEIVAAADTLELLTADEQVRDTDIRFRVPEPGANFFSLAV